MNLLVSFVLTQRVHRPDGGRNPANQRELQQQADDSRDGPANGEKLEPREENGEDEAHDSSWCFG